MTVANIYKFAAQNTLRFPSKRGDITVEQLFQLPLKSQTGFDLNEVAKAINAQLKSASEEDFVGNDSTDPKQKILQVAMEIVKDVIETKKAENAAAASRVHRAAERRKLLDAIAAKKDAALTQASMEDLEKKLAALDD